ncbi:hypothetical protein J1P26_06170 [Neobacillus sp. MM2021_6]|uniref:hypothetical protein n=1 Tax=Bacillaceae TaxID=186817 RepID=UPI00140E87EB|nr:MULTISPECIES: hypothetical protein [Bacillaceae]MBO0959314.1 hypothetical protein [Neobacillus sp. MM2021_6]NHC20579.1 hypothetical protein [Bacillus sp. MM2020_4]
MIKKLKILSIPLLLAFFAFNFLHFSNTIPHSHAEIKAIIVVDDWTVKTPSDDEKKQPLGLQTLFVLISTLTAAVIPLHLLAEQFQGKHVFLSPKFHQSNYLVLPPGS